ncbi:MAG: hypothetical protein CJBNEKGG_00612 [Prosthecobacter sp.]|nr:hypothetical protein [Prosthecobacter sp.]
MKFLTCLAFLPLLALAAEPDPDLPQPFDPTSVASLTTSSPFTRMVNMSDNLVLTGIAYIDGKPVATIFNKETKESHIVSNEPNFLGWVLNEALPAPDITRSRAVVTIGGEQVRLNYAAISADDLKGGKKDKDRDRGDRPPPPGGDGFKGERRGPSEEDRRRYESLSEKAREKFRDMMRSKFSDDKFRNAPEEERRNIIRKEFERIEKEDKGGK